MYRKILLLAFVVTILAATTIAQDTEITIQALDGKSGKPLSHQRLVIFGGESAEAATLHHTSLEATTDEAGLAKLKFDSAKTSWIQVWVDYKTLCQRKPNLNSFSVEKILAFGASSPNNCSSLVEAPTSGRFVVFARHSSLREKMDR